MLLGGFGFLSRLHGLSIDNLVEVEMVLADGRIVVINEGEYPGKLLHAHAYTHSTNPGDRSVVGASRGRSRNWNCYTVQSQGIPRPSRLRR